MIKFGKCARAGNLVLRYRNVDFFSNSRNIYYKTVAKETWTTSVRQACKQQLRRCSTETEVYESSNVDANFNDYLTNHDLKNVSDYFRNILYCGSDDKIIQKLKSCNTSEEVFDIIDNLPTCTPQQLTQALLILRDVQKTNDTVEVYAAPESYLNEISIVETPSFNKLMVSIMNAAPQMNLEELSCCLLYLYKFQVPKDVILNLVAVFEEKLQASAVEDVTLSSLARFCIPVKEFRNIWSYYTLANLVPILRLKLDSCCDYNDFRRITICFQKMVPLLDTKLLNTYVEKCQFLLEKSIDPVNEVDRLRTVLKCMRFLKYKVWFGREFSLIKQLLSSTHGSLHLLTIEEITTLHAVAFQMHESYQILNDIHQVSLQWIPQLNTTKQRGYIRLISMLYMYPGMKAGSVNEFVDYVENYLRQPISSTELHPELTDAYNLLINSELKNNKVFVDGLWNRTIKLLNSFPTNQTLENILPLCFRYMNFRSSNRYVHMGFESHALSWLSNVLTERKHVLNRSDFCKVSLSMMYFKKNLTSIPDSEYQDLLDAISRISMHDAVVVSFILSNVFHRYSRRNATSKFLRYYVHIVSELNNRTITFLKTNEHINMEGMNNVFRGYNYRDGSRSSELFRLICDKMTNVLNKDQCSKNIQDGIINFINCQHLDPAFTDGAVDYCINNKNVIHALTGATVINYCYLFGYSPARCEEFTEIISDIMIRDKDFVPIYKLVQAAVALCYFNNFPAQLTDYIFNVKFLQHVDDEIRTSINKARCRNLHQDLLELNRAVCIDFPNRDVPWFHEKYCEEKTTLASHYQTEFHRDVIRTLKELIRVEKSIQTHRYSPYYHHIDFLIHTDKRGEPVDPEKCRPVDVRKIAVCLNHQDTSGPYYKMKGKFDLHTRQLEILGYKVVSVNKHLWNSMYMSEPQAKENYLCNLIWSR